MFSYSFRRILVAVPILLGVATIVFVILHLAPGDPALQYMPIGGFSPEVLEETRRRMGLNDPLPVQYGRWLLNFLRGDFGYSMAVSMPVRDRILAVLPNTLLLAGTSLALSFLVGTALGVVQAIRQNSPVDSVLSGSALFLYSMPSFWLAIMLILILSQGAGLFPASGVTSPGHDLMTPFGRLGDRISHLVLPTLTLTLVLSGGIARYVRTSMLEVIRQDYIRTARAKGLSEHRVVLKHGLRNALIPVVTLFGTYFPFLLSGTVFTEVVFAWPGMGKLTVDSVIMRDYPTVMAGTVLFGFMVVLGNLLADLCYGLVDPRIRDGRG